MKRKNKSSASVRAEKCHIETLDEYRNTIKFLEAKVIRLEKELSKLHQPTVMHCVCEKHDYSDILVEEIDNRCIPTCKKCLKPLRKHGS